MTAFGNLVRVLLSTDVAGITVGNVVEIALEFAGACWDKHVREGLHWQRGREATTAAQAPAQTTPLRALPRDACARVSRKHAASPHIGDNLRQTGARSAEV